MNYRSPLSRARGLGSAGEGVHHWRVQRFSAIALAPLTLWLLFSLGTMDSFTYEAIASWVARPWVCALLVLFFAAAYYHASLGIQVVIEDYIGDELVRHALILAVKGMLLLMGVTTVVSVLVTAL